jgi:hypothetical protein
VSGLSVRGTCAYGVQVGSNAGSVSIVGNLFEVSAAGVRFDTAANRLRPLVDGNVTGTPGQATAGLLSVSPTTAQFSGVNSP